MDWSRWELQGRTRCYQRVLLGIVVSRVCEDFLLKKETWSHSRCCLVCKWLKFFCRILNVTGSPNRTGSNLSILSGKWMCKWVAKLWGERKWRAPTFFPCTLLPCLLLHATCLWLLLISYKWRAFLLAVKIFIVMRDGCIDIIMTQSIPSMPITPKSICQVLTSPFGSQHLSKSGHNCSNSSVAKSVNSNHFYEILLQLSEEIAPFLNKNNLLNWKVSLCCFKMLRILGHNFVLCWTPSQSFVHFQDLHLQDLRNSAYKNECPLRLHEVTGG